MGVKEKVVENLAAEHGYRVDLHDGRCDLIPREPGPPPWRDAPLEDVINYFMDPVVGGWGKLARSHGLDVQRFDVVGFFKGPRGPVFLMRDSENTPSPWCVSYGGSGKYFDTFPNAAAYLLSRFG